MLSLKNTHKYFFDNKLNNIAYFIFFYCFLFLGLTSFFYSSLYSLIFLSAILLFFSSFMHLKIIRYPILLLFFVDLILIYSSKNFYDELGSDLRIYYNIFNLLQYDPKAGFDFFGKNGEYGWGLLYYSIGNFFPNISQINLAILNVSISFFVIFVWIEKVVIYKVNKNEVGIFYLFVLIFLNISMLGFLQRQALTLGFLLFALTSKNNRNFIFFILVASFFHLSSIVVALFIWLSRSISFDLRKILFFFIGSIIFRILLVVIVAYVLSALGVGGITRKLINFTDAGFNITSLRYPILMFLVLIISIININNFKNFVDRDLKSIFNFMIFSAISLVVMMGVPLFADRIFMISLIIYGIYFYFYFYKKYRILAFILFLLYFIVFLLEKLNLVGGLPLNDSYWSRYPIFNFFLDLL